MAETTLTSLDLIKQQFWRGQLLQQAYASMGPVNRVLNVTGDVAGKGDKLNIDIMPAITVNSVGSDGALTTQTLTPTEAELTVDKDYAATIEIVRTARRQTLESLETSFVPQAGGALGAQIVTDVLALQSGISQTAGDGTGRIGKDELLKAISNAIAIDLPAVEMPGLFTYALSELEYAGLKKEGLFTELQQSGVAGGFTARIGDVFGVPTFFSSKVATSGGERKNLFFHREAFAWGIQKNMEFREADGLANAKNTIVKIVWALYGVKTVRATYATVLRGAA